MVEINKLLTPWEISFEERLKIFNGAKKMNKKIALYFDKRPDASTFRYRCYNTMQITLSSKKWQAVYFCFSEAKKIKALIKESDLLILGRQALYNEITKEVIDLARKNKKPILYDIDDLVFDKEYLETVLNTIGAMRELEFWAPYFEGVQKTAKIADGFLVTNDYIGERISKKFQKPYKVIRNSLNKEQLQASEAYLELKGTLKKKNKFTIGYFSGSPTHINDLNEALPEVLVFLENHKDAIFEIVGMMKLAKNAKKFVETGQIRVTPPVDFRKLQRKMSEVDVNIAPLVNNTFTNCKSELKFFEAAVVETTTIATPTFAFDKVIKDGENGFLAQPGEWYDKLKYLYEHPDVNKKIAKRAREYALKNYTGEEFLKEVEGAYEFFAK